MKKIHWTNEEGKLKIGYYCDDSLVKSILGGPMISEIIIDPHDYGMTQKTFINMMKQYHEDNTFPPTVPEEIIQFFISGLIPEKQKTIFDNM